MIASVMGTHETKPLLSKYGTYNIVKARFWPWVSGKVLETFQVFAFSLGGV